MSSVTDYALHTPWWIAAVIVAAGVALFFSANRRQDKVLERVGIGIFIVAVILGTLGLVFLSDVQKMERRTKDLVHAIDRKDWPALKSLLSPNTTLGTTSNTISAGRDETVSQVQNRYDNFGVKSVTVISTEGKQTDTLITVSLDVVSTQEFTQDRPIASSWQLDYQQFGDDWTLEKITLIRVGQQTGDQMVNFGR